MNIEERIEIAILIKYYGKLLTNKQLDILSMYVDSNLSLQEVSTELGISRQAVKDSLDKSYETLKKYENELHFVSRDNKIKNEIINLNIDEKKKELILSILEDF